MKTLLGLVVDKSGSMGSCKATAENGINSFLRSQKTEMKSKDTSHLILKEFSSTHHTVYNGDLKKYGCDYVLRPDGFTALNDAIIYLIDDIQATINKTQVRYQPKLKICCIVTDGGENNSRNSANTARNKIAEKKLEGWQFIFLCSDYAAKLYGQDLGIQNVAEYSVQKFEQTYEATNSLVSRMVSDSREGREIRNSFTAKELNSIK
jgi:uncharacterized protein YegL